MVITRSKRKKLENHTEGRSDNFDEIPLDLVMEILGRLRVKSVARFLIVSKSWAKIIRSRHFITSYPFVYCSSQQPRVLVAFMDIGKQRGRQHLYSFSQSLSSTSFLSRVKCPIPYPARGGYCNHFLYVNGLISLGYGEVQFITNPSTGRSIALPNLKIRTVHDHLISSFFGYDSVNDQYKVLCVVNMYGRQLSPSTQHQVLTLGAKKSWRMIKCSIPHRPLSYCHQVCIDGVVYYFAKTGADFLQWSLMRFDLNSEKFDIFTSLPTNIQAGPVYYLKTLINYKGKVAIPTKSSEYTFEVWVIDQYSKNPGWLKVSFSVEPWKSLDIIGTTHGSGELILAPSWHHVGEINVILYNPDTNNLRNAKVEVNDEYEFKSRTKAILFPNYVESVMLL